MAFLWVIETPKAAMMDKQVTWTALEQADRKKFFWEC